MSSIFVNNLKSSTGNTILIPAGHSLSLDGTVVSNNSLLPSPSGNAGKLVASNGSNLDYGETGAKGILVFTGPGTYTPSSGTRLVHVRLVGAGGGASGYGESGGSGGYAEGFFDMTGVNSVSINVGTGGSATYYSGGAGTGGSTSFGSYMSATGGRGANSSHQHCGGLPGLGSGGQINQYGGGGTGHGYNGRGGNNFFGGPGACGHPQGGSFANNHQSHTVPGTGGANGWAGSYPGNVGTTGMVVIWEYA